MRDKTGKLSSKQPIWVRSLLHTANPHLIPRQSLIPITLRTFTSSAPSPNLSATPRGSPVIPPPQTPRKALAPLLCHPPSPLSSQNPHSSPRRQAKRPLSYTEILEKQKAFKQTETVFQQAQREYTENLQSSFSHPTQKPTTAKRPSFAPKPGSRRYLLQVVRSRFGADDSAYPFPETSPQVALPTEDINLPEKRVFYRNANHFLLTRYSVAKYQAIVRAQQKPKRQKVLVKRTAGRIIRKLKTEQDQMTVYMEQLATWKEGDGTYDLAVSIADVVHVDSESVVVREESRTKENIKIGALALREGYAVAFPTETVYGLGADARNTEAVAKIYAAKKRPADNPLITHFGSLSHLLSFTAVPEIYRPLVRKFWPGPLTVLLPVKPSMRISPLVTAGLDTLAVRVPSSLLARALLLESRVPIAAPSANASTRPSPTRASHVLDDLHSRIPLILNADQDVEMDRLEQCQVGLESTVVDGLSHPPTILRLGGVSLEDIQALGGEWAKTVIYHKPGATLPSQQNEVEFQPRTPGMKYRHYSPRCPVYLYPASSTQPSHPSALIPSSLKSGRKFGYLCTANWGPFVEDPGNDLQFAWLGNDVEEIARSLFRSVRDLDEWGAEAIFVEGLEEVGLGRSVMERLRKMAGGKWGGP